MTQSGALVLTWFWREALEWETYDSFGPNHYSAEDMRRHLQGMWEPVWLHDIEAEMTEAIHRNGKPCSGAGGRSEPT